MNIFLNYDPRILKKSSDGCLLKVNLNKNKVVFFYQTMCNGSPILFKLSTLIFSRLSIRNIPSYKHLGLTFSNDLKWSLQVYNNIENIAYCTSII